MFVAPPGHGLMTVRRRNHVTLPNSLAAVIDSVLTQLVQPCRWRRSSHLHGQVDLPKNKHERAPTIQSIQSISVCFLVAARKSPPRSKGLGSVSKQ